MSWTRKDACNHFHLKCCVFALQEIKFKKNIEWEKKHVYVVLPCFPNTHYNTSLLTNLWINEGDINCINASHFTLMLSPFGVFFVTLTSVCTLPVVYVLGQVDETVLGRLDPPPSWWLMIAVERKEAAGATNVHVLASDSFVFVSLHDLTFCPLLTSKSICKAREVSPSQVLRCSSLWILAAKCMIHIELVQ